MKEWQSQTHVRWYCRYHIVIVPKYRKKAIYGVLRKKIGGVLQELCGQFGVELVEGHAMSDHIHLCLSIPPKLSVAYTYTIGRLKGKSAVRIHRDFIKGRGNAKEFQFWSTGYCVSTVGLDEAKVRQYIRHQEETDRRQEEFELGWVRLF
jgi:putative transposase